MGQVKLSGSGFCVPEKIVTNSEIVSMMNTTEEFITERTGVITRRHVEPNQVCSQLMVEAAKNAIKKSGLETKDIDLLIVNTLSPDHYDPSQACLIQPMLDLGHIPSMDIRAQCSGFLYGVQVARQFVQNKTANNVLVICGEVLSKRMDCSDDGRNLAILLGDGAGAAVVSQSDSGSGFLDIELGSDGEFFDLLMTESPGYKSSRPENVVIEKKKEHYFRMRGKPMFEHASSTLARIVNEMLEEHKLRLSDVSQVICHQPNLRILENVQQKLGINDEKMFINVHKYGNMASASLPVTWAEYEPSAKEGDLVMFLAYGAGATWGSALYRV
jgi:3-oxoacyl-(acyl-carrier-protein) synthase III